MPAVVWSVRCAISGMSVRVAACIAACVVVCMVLAWSGTSAAEVWPQPAAGPSTSGDPEVIFSFDDGPREETTPLILDELARRKIHAVFFWVGWRVDTMARARLAVVHRAVREGHLVGNHTYSHPVLCEGMSESVMADEIDRSHRLLATHTAMRIAWFRAPYGLRCPLLEALLLERHTPNLHWDIDPQEWQPGGSAEATAQYVVDKLSVLKGRGVVLLHDTKEATVRALPLILDWIDAENARRKLIGRRPIRIVQATQLAWEQAQVGVGRAFAEAGHDLDAAGRAILGSFVGVGPADLR